jgi:mono/diheme cytochrome c family protein
MNRLTLFCFLVGFGTTCCPAADAWQPSGASSSQAGNREATAQALPAVQFNRDVRPILSDKCYICHGPDAKNKHIPFRLDHEEDAKAKLPDGKHAIVESHPEQSEMIRRITAEKPAQRMPPAYTGVRLSPKEIEAITNWIAQGAKWQKHWSFLPPKHYPAPPVKDSAWVQNPIDAFVLARLEKQNLHPSPEADRETLIRRVTLDLTGLPPTPAEIDAFLNDKSDRAYEKVVDRLLASPRYGERMAFGWLDAARYADTNGYQYDGGRQMWRYRDAVIAAFNRNEPFNKFALEQLAGDMLPNATLDQKIASGFNRNNRINTEDGIIPEEYGVEYVVDRVATTSSVFLGLTLGCARCHNHKFDPFTQKEFYQLYAYFDQVPETGRGIKYGNSPPVVPAPTLDQQQKLDKMNAEIAVIEKTLADRDKSIRHAQTKWEHHLEESTEKFWVPTRDSLVSVAFDGKQPLKPEGGNVPFLKGQAGSAASFDGKTNLNTGINTPLDIDDPFTVSAWVQPTGTPDGSIVTEMIDDPHGKGFGLNLDHGKVHVNLTSVWVDDAIRVESEETLAANRWYHVTATYDGSKVAGNVRIYIDGRPAKTKVLMDTLYRPYRNGRRKFAMPVRVAGGWGPARRFHGLISSVHLYLTVLSNDEIAALADADSLSTLAAKQPSSRTPVENNILRWAFLETSAPVQDRKAWLKLAALRADKEKFERTFPTVMVMEDVPKRRETHMLVRGAYDKPGDTVQPGVPAVLNPLPANAPNNRLGFAEWVVDPSNPLLSRVTVNRFWQMYFGTGIVKSVEDFGSQGDYPSHPELLDWLATEFISEGWDVKAMQKLLVTSATYRQSSEASPDVRERDPDNRMLARAPRVRLPAEMIRDQALAAAGLLVEKIGGPSVMPYQPPGLWKEIGMQDTDYDQGHGADLYRRSLYTYVKRTAAPPTMVNFDASLREDCVVRANRTDTPLQALDLMNAEQFLEASRSIGQRMLEEGGNTPDARLRYGFRLALARYPTTAELGVLHDNLQYHLDYFSDTAKAQKYLRQGESAADPKLKARDLAAYTSAASLILNLDETITKE